QAEIGYQSVVRAEDRGAQIVARRASMPWFGAGDIGPDRSVVARVGRHGLDHGRMAAFLGRNGMRITLAGVLVAVGEFRRCKRRQHEARAESLRQFREQPGAEVWDEPVVVNSGSLQLVAPQLSVAGLGLRQLQ